jgi:K+-sensing histidine kinase KdpD
MSKKRRIMVCVTQQKSCERLIQRGDKLTKSKQDELFIVHIVKENWRYFGQLQESDALEYLFDIAKNYNASINVYKAKDIENALTDFAKKEKIDLIVMGESLENSVQQNMINRLKRKIDKKIEFDIVDLAKEEETL